MTGQHPRFRSLVRRRANGRVVTYYAYDRRPEGLPDIPLGRDYERAIQQWREIHERAPRIAGTLQEAFERWRTEALPLYASTNTRQGYSKGLRHLEPVFGACRWDDVRLPHLAAYLAKRSGKTQANREVTLLGLVWNWARLHGLTELPWPAAGLQRAKWKNPEKPRVFAVTSDLFDAVYAHADQVLRDVMDLASATGYRLTDCIEVALPLGDVLSVNASKTGKRQAFDVRLSEVLPGLIARRRSLRVLHTMLISTPTRPVTLRMLRDRWDAARAAAARQAEAEGRADLAKQIRAMYLRDMRKRAADLAGSLDEAADVLGHDDRRLTRRHYRTVTVVRKPVR